MASERKRIGRPPRPISDRFWEKVDRHGPASSDHNIGRCWVWTAGTFSNTIGYGKFRAVDRCVLAHRMSYELAFGSVASGMVVRHKCDNPTCVRPSHLELGTHADNSSDAVIRGRTASGDRNGSRLHPHRRPRGEAVSLAKIDSDTVREIRLLHRLGVSQREIARRVGLNSHSQVGNILRGKCWTHVE